MPYEVDSFVSAISTRSLSTHLICLYLRYLQFLLCLLVWYGNTNKIESTHLTSSINIRINISYTFSIGRDSSKWHHLSIKVEVMNVTQGTCAYQRVRNVSFLEMLKSNRKRSQKKSEPEDTEIRCRNIVLGIKKLFTKISVRNQ